jgi:uncharacterized protein with NRDE domain
MCTVIILRRPDHDWPLLLAGNRDEMRDRPWLPPGRHWSFSPDVVGGQDSLAGGSWLAINDHGVVATILNRHGSLGPASGKRSRGELVLEALDHADAAQAAQALGGLQPSAYRPFNLVIADNRDGYWLRHDGEAITVHELPAALSMMTSGDLNDPHDARISGYRARFAEAEIDPQRGDFSAWQALLAEKQVEGGLNFQHDSGFGTRSSAIIALPAMRRAGVTPIFLFADGPPDRCEFAPLLL